MFCVAETQAIPPVQVFDKTMVVKQMHVLEPQDLLITRTDKGTNPYSSFLFCPIRTVFLQSAYLSFISHVYFPSLTSLILLSTYIFNLSNSAVPVKTLICPCNLRKLTYKLSQFSLRMLVCMVSFCQPLKWIEIKHNCKKLLSLRRRLLFH